MRYIYIIRSISKGEHLYVGVSLDCVIRVKEHNDGRCPHTSKFRPWVLVYSEGFENDSDAFRRERQIKKWSRGKKEALIAGDVVGLWRLSKRRRQPLDH